ncbi:hypothetical protein [Amycolatopsis sp. cmx-4-68]|uniref:hypothetical protein n=1 Tax=Amycolatopsis sp. cmx-4-68 TaxID=2790938 RepID=UPI00397E1DBA
MTTLDEPHPAHTTGASSPAAAYEWRMFLGEAHCYRRAQLAAAWPPMLLPWCEENRPGPRRHERANISERRVPDPAWAATCRTCGHLLRAANREALRARA